MAKWALAISAFAFALAQNPPAPPVAPPAGEAQNPAASTPKLPDASGVFRLPSRFPDEPEKPASPKPEEPKQLVFEYTGKPIRLPFTCTDEDIQGFGMTCTEQDPCPIYLELAGAQPLGQKTFLTGNLHNGSATMYSILLASEDGGKKWVEGFERIRTAGLDQVQFIDFETGWISGQMLLALPRDPFFLVTTDGGKSWRQRPVFSETRLGVVEQFHFSSRTEGLMIFDRQASAEGNSRFELHESKTGGDSWMIRQVSARPIKLSAAKQMTGNADWRLGTDSRAGAHTVEKRSDGKWNRMASFSVRVGDCKPSPSAIPAPPAEPVAAPAPPPPPRRTPAQKPTLKK